MATYVSDSSSPTGFRRTDRGARAVVTPGKSEGTYTDASGKPITREQAMTSGRVDVPGTEAKKLAEIGANQRVGETPRTPIVGIEAARQAEGKANIERAATTREEAGAIANLLRSPTAQFGSQEVAQRGFDVVMRYGERITPEQVKASIVTPSTYHPLPQIYHEPSALLPTVRGRGEGKDVLKKQYPLYTRNMAMSATALSEKLQRGFESLIGYNERASAPIKFASGASSVITSLPSMIGTGIMGYEALARYPRAALTQAPRSVLKIGGGLVEEAKTKPIETIGMVSTVFVAGGGLKKIPTPTYRKMFGAQKGVSLTEPVGFKEVIPKLPSYREIFGAPKGVPLNEPVGISQLNPLVGMKVPGYREMFGGKGAPPSLKDLVPSIPTSYMVFGRGGVLSPATDVKIAIQAEKPRMQAFYKSEEAILAPRRAEFKTGLSETEINKALAGGSKGFTGSTESFGSKGYKPTGYVKESGLMAEYSKKLPTTPTLLKKSSITMTEKTKPSGVDWAHELNIGYAKTMKETAAATKPIQIIPAMERLKIQTVPQHKLRPVMELEKPTGFGVELYTKAELKAMGHQKTQLKRVPLSQLKTARVDIRSPAFRTFPYKKTRQQPSASKMMKISSMLKTSAITRTIPTIAAKTKTFPKVITDAAISTKTMIKPMVLTLPKIKVQTQTKTHFQLQTKTKTQTMERQKEKTKPSQKTKQPTNIMKRMGLQRFKSRKYITTLGGKTFGDLTKSNVRSLWKRKKL